MKNKKQMKPKWFNGVVYQEGSTVRNQFSGETCELNALELSIYDFVMGANMTLEMLFVCLKDPKRLLFCKHFLLVHIFSPKLNKYQDYT